MFKEALILSVLMIAVCKVGGHGHGDKHECDRACNADEAPRECVYNFNVEWYRSMSKKCGSCLENATDCDAEGCIRGDGRAKPVMVVNRMLPGPAIRVCHRDIVVVNVENNLVGSESLAIHWHGILQNGTPFMDGAPMVTQCPILRGTSFQYKFEADPPGTHWWHAHTGLQRGEGVAGVLIVKQDSRDDLSTGDFDEAFLNRTFPFAAVPMGLKNMDEHTILIYDWSVQSGMDRIINFNYGGPIFFADNVLINGIGYTDDTVNNSAFRNKFTVEEGKKYRFRVISNVVTFCPTDISVDNHKLTIIATDGVAVEPYTVTNLYVRSGERFDFVIHANQSAANYWFRFKTEVECNFIHNAYLNYAGVSQSVEPTSTEWSENHMEYKIINKLETPEGFITNLVPKYSEKFPKDERIEGPADVVHFMWAGIVEEIRLELNGVFNIPASSPLLSQPEETPLTCNPEDTSKNHTELFCTGIYCPCVHVIDVRLNDVVDLVVFDRSKVPFSSAHVMHLHGYNKSNEEVFMHQIKEAYDQKKDSFNTVNPIVKDTVLLPMSGYQVLRFYADKPGAWLFHCHYGMHVNFGMSVTIRVGYPDHFPTPPYNFPKCGSWKKVDPPPTTATPTTTSGDRLIYSSKFGTILTITLVTMFLQSF